MTYFCKKNELLLKKSNKKTAIITISVALAGALAIVAALIMRTLSGRVFSQVAVTLIFAFACCFSLVSLQLIAENKRILQLFSTMNGRKSVVDAVFDKEDGTITKNGLTFRQLYFTVDKAQTRYLVFEKCAVPAFAAGQTVKLIAVGNVVKEWL